MSRPDVVRVLPCGDAALLLEVGDLDAVLDLAAALDAARERGDLDPARDPVIDIVPAARTVLLRLVPGTDLARVTERVRALPVTERPKPPSEVHTVRIAVRYDGEDLDEVATLTGLDRDEVVARHQAATWRVAFTGFAPGFGYLVGDDASLEVPRRDVSRPQVPAGAVGLAGEFSGVYPRSSPGGWQLIGRTDDVMWDPERDPPALLTPGTVVRFEAAGS